MKLKIFVTVFISFFLVMATNSGGRAVGDRLKYAASLTLVERVAGENMQGLDSNAELVDMFGSQAHRETFIAENRRISTEYGRYMAVSLLVQGLLLIGIALGATGVIIRLVSRNAS